MKRRIIEIDQNKCNGCGACAAACHEGAIAMVNGKGRALAGKRNMEHKTPATGRCFLLPPFLTTQKNSPLLARTVDQRKGYR